MDIKKTAIIVAGAAVACFSIGCFVGYYSMVSKQEDKEKVYSVDETVTPEPSEEAVASVDGEVTEKQTMPVYCILANDAGLYMYKIDENGSEVVASDSSVVLSLLPGSDRYRLSNGIECETEEKAWSVWECFTS